MQVKINLNETIKVKLTPKGIDHYFNYYRDINLSRELFNNTIKIDNECYTDFQFHSFIDIFGGLGMQLNEYVDLNILIE